MTTRRDNANDDANASMAAADGCAAFEAMLPDYMEGSLSDSDTGAARAHIAGCESCRALVRDLERIRTQAAALPVQRPARDLWAGIEARIQEPISAKDRDAGKQSRVPRWFVSGWSAATLARAAVLVIATAGITVVATRRLADHAVVAPSGPQQTAPQATSPATPPANPQVAANTASVPRSHGATPTIGGRTPVAVTTVANGGGAAVVAAPTSEFIYDQQIVALHRILDARRGQLNPKTVATIEKNLRVIDAAIAESRAALAKDPANGFLAQQLDATLSTKLDLLRTVAMLPSRT